MESRKELIFACIEDAVAELLCYNRKEDDELSFDDVCEALRTGEITVDEMAEKFKSEILAASETMGIL